MSLSPSMTTRTRSRSSEEKKMRSSDNPTQQQPIAKGKRSKQEEESEGKDCNNGSITTQDSGTNPLSVLSSDNCTVQTLTVSDQHATLLISHGKDLPVKSSDAASVNDEAVSSSSVKSLLKLTLVPFHKAILGSNPVLSPQDSESPERNFQIHKNAEASAQMVSFLKGYEFKLKSESGAEYSYYTARPSNNLHNLLSTNINTNAPDPPIHKDTENHASLKAATVTLPSPFSTCDEFQFGSFDVELISPANNRQISRAMPSLGSTLIHETPQLYQNIVQPYIQSIVDGGSLGWINNIIQVKKEKERLLVNSDQFIINIDTKWRTHPPPLTTPREQWYDHKSVADLYCLGIIKQKGIASLRDLRGEHVPMLKSIQQQGFDAIENIYGVKSDQIRCFVHYQPQFYHFHVHFTRLENEVGSTVERGHLVCDIVQNLEMDPQYYCKRTIAYKLKKGAPLQNLIENHVM